MCGENWHLVGNSCLKFITAKDTYDNAKLACRSHNALLASLTTQKKVDFVLKELQSMSLVVRMKTGPGLLLKKRSFIRTIPGFRVSDVEVFAMWRSS